MEYEYPHMLKRTAIRWTVMAILRCIFRHVLVVLYAYAFYKLGLGEYGLIVNLLTWITSIWLARQVWKTAERAWVYRGGTNGFAILELKDELDSIWKRHNID